MTRNLTVIDSDYQKVDRTLLPKTALRKIEHVRDEMSRVYRQARSGKIDSQEASRYVYILDRLAKVIEHADLEKRLEVLEETGSSRFSK